MALIIKGNIPKGCGWDCHYVAVNKYYDERDDKIHKCVFCTLNHSIRYKDSGFPEEYEHTRHPDCPIIGEIPDEHGRLGDLDKLYKDANNLNYASASDILEEICCTDTVLEASND